MRYRQLVLGCASEPPATPIALENWEESEIG